MSTTLERRTFTEQIEIRSEGKDLVAYGYAYRFNTLSQNLGGFVESIAPGAGKKSIADDDIRGLFNHDPNLVLGRSRAGTLSMEEDGTGGTYEIRLPDTPTGRELATNLELGNITGSSFGFRTISDDWSETEQEFPLRTLTAFSMRDVGPVTFPAYLGADSALRSLAETRSLDPNTVLEAARNNNLAEILGKKQENDAENGQRATHPPRFRHLV